MWWPADLPVSWTINNTLSDAQEGTELLAPDYATKLTLGPGENLLALYPQESFAVSTGDAKFFAYVKVVDDLSQVDEEAIRQEVDGFQTLIYPDSVFESAGHDLLRRNTMKDLLFQHWHCILPLVAIPGGHALDGAPEPKGEAPSEPTQPQASQKDPKP